MVDYKTLTFGIEIELTLRRRFEVATILANKWGTTAVYAGGTLNEFHILDNQSRIWKVVRDASIRAQARYSNGRVGATDEDDYKVEVVSPILTIEDIDELQDIIRLLRQNKLNPNKRCGIHIHVGWEDEFGYDKLRNLINIVYSKQHLLNYALKVDEDRKEYCADFTDSFIKLLNKKKPKTKMDFADIWYKNYATNRHSKYNQSRYRVLNLHNYFSDRIKAVEYRIFESTLHAGEIKAYIYLCLMITASAINAKHTVPRVTIPNNGNYKYSVRVWLLKLGMIGDEYKNIRMHLLKNTKGNAAFKTWEEQPF